MDHVLKNLDDLKYSELQKIAKSVGIKANVKIDKLQKALREYYTEQTGNKTRTTPKHEATKAGIESMETDEKQSEEEKESKNKGKRVTKKAKRRGGRRKAAVKEEEEAQEEKTGSTPAKERSRKSTPVQKGKEAGSNKSTPVLTKLVSPPRAGSAPSTPMTPQMKSVMNLKQTKTPMSQKRKRSGSIPRPVAGDSKPSTPVVEPSNKRLRRSTFEKSEDVKVSTPTAEKTASPGVKEMLGAMKANMSSAERKATLLKVLDEKVQKVKGTSSPSTSVPRTQIPRFAAFLAKKEAQKKPITPGNKDWTKVHQKEFDKFDSIDVYLQKKRQRTKSVTKSVSKVSQIIEESKKAISSLKNHNTPNNENKPSPKVNHTNKANLFKSPGGKSPFKPTVFKTKNINTNFTTKTPGASGSTKTPLNKGPVKKATPKAGTTVEKNVERKSIGAVSAKKFNGVTPFKFTATLNTTMPDMKSAKKPAFDLKASLARPITWKAHKGKLKPLTEDAANNVKTPKTVSKEDRRAAIANHRADRKLQSQMQRRGIKA